MIIFDENVHQVFVDLIVDKGYKILSIKNEHAGISDKEIMQLAKSLSGIIVTEDKDFGELVYSHGVRDCSVIFLRYKISEIDSIKTNLLKILENVIPPKSKFFVTITKNKIRIKSL